MSPELAKGHAIVAKAARTTRYLLAISLTLLMLLGGVFAYLSHRQNALRDSVREDAVWAAYQFDREARALKEALAELDRKPTLDKADRKFAALRYDILYSRLSVLDDASFADFFADSDIMKAKRSEARAQVLAMEPSFDSLTTRNDPLAATLRTSLDELTTVTGDLLVYTNSAVSVSRADARIEVTRLQNVAAGVVLALGISIVFMILSLKKQLHLVRMAGAELERIARKLSESYHAAEAGNRAKSEFMATIGHEIRTPLNAILGMAELLKLSALPPEERENVQAIESSGNALLEIINEILDFTKIEHGDEALELIPFDVADLAQQAIRIVEGRAREAGNTLTLDLSGVRRPATYLGDPLRVRRVVLNLLSNAVKFTTDGVVRLRISEVGDQCPMLRFEVTDSGIGIAEEARPLLFQAFSQVDSTIGRRYGGTGLGLAICKRIVDAAQGRIGVESAVGVGSMFWFEIPAEPTGTALSVISEPLSIQPPRPKLSILLVEDNAFNRRVAVKFLERLGQTVQTVDNGLAAVEAVAEQAFDLILMDMQMPVMDGVAAAEAIRDAGGAAARTPIIALTANASDCDRQRCLEAGMIGFEPKPLSLARLAVVIERYAPPEKKTAASAAVSQTVPQLLPAPSPAWYAGATSEPSPLPQADVDSTRTSDLIDILGREGFDELQQAFFDAAAGLLADLHKAVRANDPALSEHVLHSLKGAAANIGYSGLEELAETLRHAVLDTATADHIALHISQLHGLTRASGRGSKR